MQAERLEARYGNALEVDVCQHCNGLWFDGRESLMLSPGSTLKLFGAMYERRASARQPLVPEKRCPRCAAALVETSDLQRGTRFTYFRCDAHGRYSTFFQFLREKSLVRAPTPRQLTELQAQIKQVACSNCGSPIVLAQTADCSHCHAPVSILSEESINQTLKELHDEDARRKEVDPTLAARLVMDQLQVKREAETLYRPARYTWSTLGEGVGAGSDLVQVGAWALTALIKGLLS